MIKVIEFDVLATVGYAEMWLDRQIFFFCEINGGSTGTSHVVPWDRFEALSNQVLFYKDGKLTAYMAPYIEWQDDIDVHDMTNTWHDWQKQKDKLAYSRKVAVEWRHMNF